jgi:hypothetical protein
MLLLSGMVFSATATYLGIAGESALWGPSAKATLSVLTGIATMVVLLVACLTFSAVLLAVSRFALRSSYPYRSFLRLVAWASLPSALGNVFNTVVAIATGKVPLGISFLTPASATPSITPGAGTTMAGIGVFQLWMVALVILGMITLHSSRFWTERARSSGHRGA